MKSTFDEIGNIGYMKIIAYLSNNLIINLFSIIIALVFWIQNNLQQMN